MEFRPARLNEKRGRLQQFKLLILSNHLLLSKRQNIDHPYEPNTIAARAGGNLYFNYPMKYSPKIYRIGFVFEY